MKKRRISLEEEKKTNELLWKEILNDIALGNIDIERISHAMQRINTLDHILIKENRRDLLG